MTATTQLRAAGEELDEAGLPPRRRRGARAALAVAGLAAAGGLAWTAAAGDGEQGAGSAVSDRVPTTTAVVSRRDLVDREDVDGALTFSGERTVTAGAAGTVTRVRAEGSTARRGQSLFSLDEKATAYVMYGRVPMYRTLRSGVSDGNDVRQLERNLVALGYDPNGTIKVDDHWASTTTAAVLRWQRDRGMTRDGVIERGEIVFSDGPVRVGEHKAKVGDRVGPGQPVTAVTSRRSVVVGRLDASRQSTVRRGQQVRVTLPDGREVAGVVTRVGRVAKAGENGEEATVELRVALTGRAARRLRLDQAPVTVSIETSRAKRVLAIPVTALVALGGGRYGVEVQGAGGSRRLVPVRTGAFADGYVEVSGVAEGARVVVPR
jgi:peptidoglycan hydrolase-like protein with peptidoglycan-binding domain